MKRYLIILALSLLALFAGAITVSANSTGRGEYILAGGHKDSNPSYPAPNFQNERKPEPKDPQHKPDQPNNKPSPWNFWNFFNFWNRKPQPQQQNNWNVNPAPKPNKEGGQNQGGWSNPQQPGPQQQNRQNPQQQPGQQPGQQQQNWQKPQPQQPDHRQNGVRVSTQWAGDRTLNLTWTITNNTGIDWCSSDIDILCSGGTELLTNPTRYRWDIPHTVRRGETLTFTVNIYQPAPGQTMNFKMMDGGKTLYSFEVRP